MMRINERVYAVNAMLTDYPSDAITIYHKELRGHELQE